jgi:hypothetical protein
MQLRSGKVIHNNTINKNNFIKKIINEIAETQIDETIVLSDLEYREKIIEFTRLWSELYYYISVHFDNINISRGYKELICNLGIKFNMFIDNLDISIDWSDFEYNYLYDAKADILDVISCLS